MLDSKAAIMISIERYCILLLLRWDRACACTIDNCTCSSEAVNFREILLLSGHAKRSIPPSHPNWKINDNIVPVLNQAWKAIEKLTEQLTRTITMVVLTSLYQLLGFR